jgi:preprotein translocase subunit SecF
MEEPKEEIKKREKKFAENFEKFYDKRYKLLLLIPVLLLTLSFIFIIGFHAQHNDFIYKDISISGGTSITLNSGSLNINTLKQDLPPLMGDIDVRSIKDLVTQQQKAVIIDTTKTPEEATPILEKYLGYNLTEKNSSIEFTNSTLGGSFYQQLLIAVLIAFAFMSIVVFIIFKTPVPSGAVIISAFADIFMTLIVVDLIGMKISTAGIIAFLMLIGYSVDTDILLTTRVLKRDEGSINSRVFKSFKTGTTMTLTSLVAILSALIITGSLSPSLHQIFSILSIGLGFDLLNTWITNASIIKWYATKKRK